MTNSRHVVAIEPAGFPPPDFSALRVLVVHDWITAWAGSERVLEQILTLLPQADLVVGVLDGHALPSNTVTERAKETWMRRIPLARRHHRWFLPFYPAAFASLDTRGYDLVISSAHAFAKCVRPSAGTPHVCYCHSPPRYLWDLQHDYQRESGLASTALSFAAPLLRRVDRASARRVDHFVANSHYIADRIRRAYGRDASVVYPPVTPKPVPSARAARSDALLALGRLVPYKRVDLAIEMANALGERLIVAGDGPERARLERLAGPTVTFEGDVSELRAGELMESCRSMVFCAEEDFGIAPVEANMHGLPVIAYGRGALRESMVDGVTAQFFDEPSVASLSAAVQRSRGRDWDHQAIRANGNRFSAERFRTEFAQLVVNVLATRGAGVSSVDGPG